MSTYFSDIGGGAAIFTGFTAEAGSGCVSVSKTTAVAETAALPHAPIKMVIKPATAAFCGSSVKARMTNNQPTGWWAGWSFAVPTAYTAAMKVSPVSLNANFKKALGQKVWIDAYNAAGAVQASALAGTHPTTGATSHNSIVMNTTAFVTVPANGFLVLRVDYFPSTSKGTGKGEIKLGATAATSGLKFVTTEVPAISGPQADGAITDGNDVAAGVADVQLISITHVFKNEADSAFWANGINVVAYKASTMSDAVPTVLGNAAIAGGVGSVTINLIENSDVVLVPDHLHASAPTGEQGISEALTPTVV